MKKLLLLFLSPFYNYGSGFSLNISPLQNGVYFVKTNGGAVSTVKIIKQ